MRQGAGGQRLQLDVAQVQPAVAQRHRHHLARCHPVPGRHFARDGEPPAFQHEAVQHRHRVAGKHGLQVDLLAAAGDVDHLPQRGVGRRQCHRVFAQPRQRQRPGRRQRVIGPHQGQDGRGLLVLHPDVLLRRAAEGQADVGIAGAQPRRHLAGRHHGHVEHHALMHAAKLHDQRRQEVAGKTLGAGNAHPALSRAAQGVEVFQHPVGVHAAAARMRRQDLAGRRGHHAARLALEQHRVQRLFQPRDLPADGRGGHMQPLGSHRQRAAAHHFQKIAQRRVLQVMGAHRSSSLRRACLAEAASPACTNADCCIARHGLRWAA